jgi:hypothetical protein
LAGGSADDDDAGPVFDDDDAAAAAAAAEADEEEAAAGMIGAGREAAFGTRMPFAAPPFPPPLLDVDVGRIALIADSFETAAIEGIALEEDTKEDAEEGAAEEEETAAVAANAFGSERRRASRARYSSMVRRPLLEAPLVLGLNATGCACVCGIQTEREREPTGQDTGRGMKTGIEMKKGT